MANTTQRDAFWTRIYEMARQDRDIIVVSEDMGAPALDQFRTDLPGQFVNVGIAEQIGLLLGGGLAFEGKRPFIYAIAPFVTLRCLEQIRVTNAIMNIPVTLVGVGAGFGYEDSGPTHHLTEDIAVMRAFPNITVHSPADGVCARAIAEMSRTWPNTNYVRLDRKPMPEIYPPDADFSRGFSVLKSGRDGLIVSTGVMTHTALEVAGVLEKKGKQLGVVDVFQIPTQEDGLAAALKDAPRIFTVEEHFLPGGLGSYILEILNTRKMAIPVRRIGLDHAKGYCYQYGGREVVHEYYGVHPAGVQAAIESELR
jgi:transketolase